MDRRSFLRTSAIGGSAAAASTLAAPAYAQGKRTLTMVTSWPRGFAVLDDAATYLENYVAALSDGELTIDEIEDAAKLACDTMRDETEILTNFESVEEKDAAFLCTDLTYIVALLEKGFKKNDWKSVRLVKQVEYRGQNVEVAWALGAALNALASSS